ncbi:TRAP transporter small permease [Ochrobactrum chromiisoli]|uniref:TRAP transporter small permease protein n=1 Tax=Ochrobactrum chromiisoli TaxID=2993941 RepID=A0ABT3QRM2_9HYPH|nr:TRAP transporter small permease subunit [Ochrobactrum chromiisoli]MCX2698269.1 TRAP transporter small permease subunit [Ochrobactrum chromiisoli]
MRISAMGEWLRKRAENIQALMLAVMFFSFILQIVFRYFLNWPTGWSSELTVIMWLWIVLWGAAFVVREDEEIRFDLIYASVTRGVRRIMVIISSLILIGLYLYSLRASWDYVTFMKIQSTAYLKIRFDIVFSIYIIFLLAVVCRYMWILWHAIFDRAALKPEDVSGPVS